MTGLKKTQENSGRLLSVWCPECKTVTEKVSFNLLREAGTVKIICPRCSGLTIITYDGKTAELSYLDTETMKIFKKAAKGEGKWKHK
jgi:phage FluMu protein Com